MCQTPGGTVGFTKMSALAEAVVPVLKELEAGWGKVSR